MVDIVLEARDIVANGWCQGTSFRQKNGRSARGVTSTWESACLVGSLYAAAYPYGGHTYDEVGNALFVYAFGTVPGMSELGQSRYPTTRLAMWNDIENRTQTEVVELLDGFATHLKGTEA